MPCGARYPCCHHSFRRQPHHVLLRFDFGFNVGFTSLGASRTSKGWHFDFMLPCSRSTDSCCDSSSLTTSFSSFSPILRASLCFWISFCSFWMSFCRFCFLVLYCITFACDSRRDDLRMVVPGMQPSRNCVLHAGILVQGHAAASHLWGITFRCQQ